MPELLRPDGCRLYYEVHGVPAAEPLLLLEGAGGDIPGWTRNIPHLAETLHVIAYDHRGNGWSDAPDEPQTMKTFVDDAIAILDNLEIERAHVYGQSFGGMVALELALAWAERVRTLVLASTHAGGRSVIPVRIPKGEAALAIFSAAYAAADALRDRIRELGYDVTDTPEGGKLEPVAAPGEQRLSPREVASVLDEPAAFDFSVHWIVQGRPGDVLRGIEALGRH